MNKIQTCKRWLPRLLAGAVGLILLIAGLVKSTEMEIFIRQIRGYGIISDHTVLIVIAWGLTVAECVLGTALVTGFLPGITIPVSAFLMFIFLCATAWAWLTGVAEDCGCFGSWISRSPGEALLEDLLLLAALFPAWWGRRRRPVHPARLGYVSVSAAFLIGLCLPPAFGIPFSPSEPSPETRMDIRQELSGVQGIGPVEVKNGRRLVVLMETDCTHCRESVMELNFLAGEKEIPEMIALCPNDEEQVRLFRDQFRPVFPVGRVTGNTFWRLLGDGEIPRTMLLQDGNVLRVWDHKIPDMEEVVSSLQEG